MIVLAIYSCRPSWQQRVSLFCRNGMWPRHYMADMDIRRVDLASSDCACQHQRTMTPSSGFLFEPFGHPVFLDPDHVCVNPGHNGGGETGYDVDTRVELFTQGRRIVYEGRDMHIMRIANEVITDTLVRCSADRLAPTAGIHIVRGGSKPTVGPLQLLKGCKYVATLNLPGQPL